MAKILLRNDSKFLETLKFIPFNNYIPALWNKTEKALRFKGCATFCSNLIYKKEPKSNNRLSKFDWHNLSPIFWAIMFLHKPKVFWKPIKNHLLAIHWYNRADQILTYDHQMLIWFLVIWLSVHCMTSLTKI